MTNEFNIPAASHHLELTGGERFVGGRIDSVAYEDSPGHQGGFFSRLFG